MSKSKRIILWLLLGIVVPILVFILTKFLTFINYKCPWYNMFHFLCAGCGVTRMIKMIFELEFYKAFLYNPLFFMLLIICTIYYFYILFCIMLNKKYYKPNMKCLYSLIVILIIFMILRNIPGSVLYDLWP